MLAPEQEDRGSQRAAIVVISTRVIVVEFVERHDRGDRFEHRRFAERGHDFDRFNNRHRVFRNGVWVWVYGPDYYAYGNDCWWLRQQAYATGSPYWWSRYNYCVGYY